MRRAVCLGASVLALPAQADAAPRLAAPAVAATRTVVSLRASGIEPWQSVRLEIRHRSGWKRLRGGRAGREGRETFRFKPKSLKGRYRLRVATRAGASRARTLRSRPVSLAAVGDINLGDGPAAVMRARGRRYPWRAVAPVLRRADIALGNLECAVSRRGRPVPKLFNFRGTPGALRVAVRFAGIDVFNLANNHSVDYGRTALRDAIRFAHKDGATTVGAGRNLEAARRPRVITRLGLRVAFVGFSDILPYSFAAGPSRSGTAFASPQAIRQGVRAAGRRADVVVATFHWGQERSTHPNARQQLFARIALRAGAHAVIGAHPHVLQPRSRRGRRAIAYSLGNFIWTPGSGITARTGILDLRLSARGVERMRLRRALIVGGQPRLRRL